MSENLLQQEQPPRGLRKDISELIRNRIRDEALVLFTTDGYRSTTIRQIARAAGTTHTTIYAYYRSKLAIAFAILETISPQVEAFYARIGEILRDRDAFALWFDQYVAFWSEHRGAYQAFWEATRTHPPVAAQMRKVARKLVGAALIPYVADDRHCEQLAGDIGNWLISLDHLLEHAHAMCGEAELGNDLRQLRLTQWAVLAAIRDNVLGELNRPS